MAAGAFWLVFALSVARSENDESVDSLLALESGLIQRLPQLPPIFTMDMEPSYSGAIMRRK